MKKLKKLTPEIQRSIEEALKKIVTSKEWEKAYRQAKKRGESKEEYLEFILKNSVLARQPIILKYAISKISDLV